MYIHFRLRSVARHLIALLFFHDLHNVTGRQVFYLCLYCVEERLYYSENKTNKTFQCVIFIQVILLINSLTAFIKKRARYPTSVEVWAVLTG